MPSLNILSASFKVRKVWVHFPEVRPHNHMNTHGMYMWFVVVLCYMDGQGCSGLLSLYCLLAHIQKGLTPYHCNLASQFLKDLEICVQHDVISVYLKSILMVIVTVVLSITFCCKIFTTIIYKATMKQHSMWQPLKSHVLHT